MKFRFQLTGYMEFGADMTIAEVTKHLSNKLVGAEIVGATIYRVDGKKRIRKKGL